MRILRPQEIPTYLADGLFDLGIAGRDWIEETSAEVVTIGRLEYSKATANPVRIVVAVGADSPWREARDLPQGVRVSTEYPRLTKRYFEGLGIDADVRLSYGATEAKVPDIVDCIVELTETGRALRAAGPADHRHGHDLLHRAHRQPGGGRRSRPSHTPCTSCTRCWRGCSRPGARCW